MRHLLDHAAEHDYGVPAFNINNLEQVQATSSPVILQASAGARKYAGEAYLRHMVLAAIETHPDIPVVLHQDHGASAAVCVQAIRSGFSSVMMDGSLLEDAKTPASYDYNVRVTADVCRIAQQPAEFDPRKALAAATRAAQALCQQRFDAFGCAGMAGWIRANPVAMA